jgi:hypothetical protein
MVRTSTWLWLVLASLCLGACTDALLEPSPQQSTSLDDRLAVRGRVCTDPPATTGFPVKILFLVDSSGSMCVTDPPGSQGTGTFCEMYGTAPPGVTQPGRVRALKSIMAQFRQDPNVQVALVPWETKIVNPQPPTGFEPASMLQDTDIDALQTELGKGTDYQGALNEAYSRILTDIQATPKALQPRTKYVVVFLTDGVPFPRCAADNHCTVNPNDVGCATANNPNGTWYDSPGAGCTIPPGDPCANPGCYCLATSYCNSMMPTCNPLKPGSNCQQYLCGCQGCQGEVVQGGNCDPTLPCGYQPIPNGPPIPDACIPGYEAGTDHNQDYQILNAVDQVMSLKQQYHIGDLRMHTLMLFNLGAALQCGQICATDLFNGFAPQDAIKIGTAILTKMATHGQGTFQVFYDGASISYTQLDYTSLASQFVMKSFIADNLNAMPTVTAAQIDSDQEGLIDTLDQQFVDGTSPFNPYTAGDCLNDAFKYYRQAEGFQPGVLDPRGCQQIPNGPPPTCGSCATGVCMQDLDGDGLTDCEENYLGTDDTIVDSNADGIPDGTEVRFGINPAVPNNGVTDYDGDGVPDLQEILGHTNPLVNDPIQRANETYLYQVNTDPQPNGSVCYDFLVSNIKLVTPQTSGGGQVGFNTITLMFDEAPASNVTNDYGQWRVACVSAQFAPPSVRAPVDPEIDITDADFVPVQNCPANSTAADAPLGSSPKCFNPNDLTSVQATCKGAVPQ